MNPHFQPYTEISNSQSPSPENNNACYTNLSSSTNVGSNGNSCVTNGGAINDNISGNVSNMVGNSLAHHQNGHGQQHNMSIDVGNGVNGSGSGASNGINGGSGGMGSGSGTGGQPNFHQLNNNNNNISTIKQCAGCGGKIVERFLLHALDRYWHNSCLKCYCCGAMLADIGSSCYTRGGMILCKPDYSRMFGTAQCSACGQTIAPNEFVMRTTSPISSQQPTPQQQQQQQQQQPPNQSSSAASVIEHQKHFEHHVFHLKCFTCSKCASQLRPGDRYYMLGGSLVCEQDWMKLLKSSGASTPVRKGKVGRPRRSRD